MPSRICHLIDSNIDTAFFRSIARHHDRQDFPVRIGSIAPAGPLQRAMTEEGIPTFTLGVTRRWQYTLAVARLLRVIRQERIGVLHAHCFDPTVVGLVAARLAGIRFVFTRHHSDHHLRLGKKWHTRVDGWCARRADAVIAVSEATRSILLKIEGVPGAHLHVVYNGMEPLREPSHEGMAAVRHELGLGPEPILLVLARLHEEKGHRYLFEALTAIQARVGRVQVLLGGDGPHRAALEADVRRRAMGNEVRFLGRRDDVPELLGLASVLVLPSLAESFGFVCAEAMSLGKPVVATMTGGIPEVVVHEETGLLVPPAMAGPLAEAICRILSDVDLAACFGTAGRQRARQFSIPSMMRGYEAVYRSLCGKVNIATAPLAPTFEKAS